MWPAALAWRLGCLVAACMFCRFMFQFSGQLGLCFAVALCLGVPGLALANIAGLRARVTTPELLGLIPVTGLAVWAPPFAVGLLIHAPFRWIVVVVLVVSGLLLSWDPRPMAKQIPWEPIGVLTGAFAFTGVATRYVPSIWGDALFHAGLIRKLLALPGISISGISPYHDGHAHAGYWFPILHAVEAGAMSITGGDPTLDYQNLTPAFAWMIPIAAYALGRSLANPPVALAAALFTCWHVMSLPPELSLAKQPPYFTLLVMFPAVIVILNHLYRDRVGRSWWFWTIVSTALVGFLHDTSTLILLPLIVAAVVLRPRSWPALVGSIAVTLVIFAGVFVFAIRGGGKVVRNPGFASQWITIHGHQVANFRAQHSAAPAGGAVRNDRGGGDPIPATVAIPPARCDGDDDFGYRRDTGRGARVSTRDCRRPGGPLHQGAARDLHDRDCDWPSGQLAGDDQVVPVADRGRGGGVLCCDRAVGLDLGQGPGRLWQNAWPLHQRRARPRLALGIYRSGPGRDHGDGRRTGRPGTVLA